jgi:hypothetical protein
LGDRLPAGKQRSSEKRNNKYYPQLCVFLTSRLCVKLKHRFRRLSALSGRNKSSRLCVKKNSRSLISRSARNEAAPLFSLRLFIFASLREIVSAALA